jgi:hypothetical protein
MINFKKVRSARTLAVAAYGCAYVCKRETCQVI